MSRPNVKSSCCSQCCCKIQILSWQSLCNFQVLLFRKVSFSEVIHQKYWRKPRDWAQVPYNKYMIVFISLGSLLTWYPLMWFSLTYSVDSIKLTVLLNILSLLSILFSTVISKTSILKILYIKKKKYVKS